jgi:hypothetical protein
MVRACRTFAVPCGYAIAGLEFYYIPQPILAKSKHDGCNGTVTIVEGSLTEEQITSELKRLVASDREWSVKCLGNNVFSTSFPSVGELHRMIEWGTVHTKFGAKMQVKEEGSREEIKYVMPKVLVQFTRLPRELREYPLIWAVGSMLGISKEVDTVFTRKFDRARLQVAVLDPNLIPQYVDVVVGDYIYELKFKVEVEVDGDQPMLMDMDDFGAYDDGDFQDQSKDDNLGEKGSRGSDSLDPSNGTTGAVDKASTAKQNSNKTGANSVRDGGPAAIPYLAQMDLGQPQETGSVVGIAIIEALGGIPEVTGSVHDLRRSKRRTDSVSEDSLVRAEKLTAGYNLDDQSSKGNGDTFVDFSDSFIYESFKTIGILAGSNPSSDALSISQLKQLEINRDKEQRISKPKNALAALLEKDVEEEEEFNSFILNHLCGDTMHDVIDGNDELINSACTKPYSHEPPCPKKKSGLFINFFSNERNHLE